MARGRAAGAAGALGAVAAWLVSAALTLYCAAAVWSAVIEAVAAAGGGGRGLLLASYLAIILLGGLALVLSLWLQAYYRQGLGRGLLLRRLVRVTLAQAGVAALAFIVRYALR